MQFEIWNPNPLFGNTPNWPRTTLRSSFRYSTPPSCGGQYLQNLIHTWILPFHPDEATASHVFDTPKACVHIPDNGRAHRGKHIFQMRTTAPVPLECEHALWTIPAQRQEPQLQQLPPLAPLRNIWRIQVYIQFDHCNEMPPTRKIDQFYLSIVNKLVTFQFSFHCPRHRPRQKFSIITTWGQQTKMKRK